MSRKESRENAFILLFEAECRDDETALEIFEYAEQVKEFAEKRQNGEWFVMTEEDFRKNFQK